MQCTEFHLLYRWSCAKFWVTLTVELNCIAIKDQEKSDAVKGEEWKSINDHDRSGS